MKRILIVHEARANLFVARKNSNTNRSENFCAFLLSFFSFLKWEKSFFWCDIWFVCFFCGFCFWSISTDELVELHFNYQFFSEITFPAQISFPCFCLCRALFTVFSFLVAMKIFEERDRKQISSEGTRKKVLITYKRSETDWKAQALITFIVFYLLPCVDLLSYSISSSICHLKCTRTHRHTHDGRNDDNDDNEKCNKRT